MVWFEPVEVTCVTVALLEAGGVVVIVPLSTTVWRLVPVGWTTVTFPVTTVVEPESDTVCKLVPVG